MILKITTTCNWLICRTPLQDLSRKTIGTYILTAKKYSVNAIHNWPRLLKLSYLEWPRLILIYNCICHRCCNFLRFINWLYSSGKHYPGWLFRLKISTKTKKTTKKIQWHTISRALIQQKITKKIFFHLISGSNFCVMLLIVISLPLTGGWATVLFCACVFRDCLDRVIELKLQIYIIYIYIQSKTHILQ